MNDTKDTTTSDDAAPDDEFDAGRLRTLDDVRRSRDDRVVAGVCAGVARYLRVDPVVVRVVIAVLTVVGLAGVVLYAAAWVLLPEEGADKSLAAEWFHLDENEDTVRRVGLVAAGAVAVLAVLGDGPWGGWGSGRWDWGFPWFLVPLGLLWFVFVVRPRRRRARVVGEPVAPSAPDVAAVLPAGPLAEPPLAEPPWTQPPRTQPPRTPRPRRSKALVGLTFFVALIALAVTRIAGEVGDGVAWTTYVAVALGVVGLGLVVGAFVGYGRPLIPVGVGLSLALAFGALLPSSRIGEQDVTPQSSAEVESRYLHGVGELQVDLSGVVDPTDLEGRTITVRNGIGDTEITVPAGVNVRVESTLRAGQINVFDRTADGTDNSLTYPAASDGAALTIRVHQGLGEIEVVRP